MPGLPASWTKIIAFLLGMVLCFFSLASVEWLLELIETKPATKVSVKYKPFPYKSFGISGVMRAVPGQYQVQEFKEYLGSGKKEFIYDVTYTIDQFGNRRTPVDKLEGRSKNAIFFGCSFAFGEGLNDDQTIPYYFAQQTVDYEPYNFGFHGDGPFDILAKVENYQLDKILKHKKGIIIYVLLNGHVFRVTGDMREVTWGDNRPFYKLVDGEIRRHGNFLTGRKFLTNTLRFLKKSRILKQLKIARILPVTESGIKTEASAIKTAFDILQTKLPGFESYLLVYPQNPKEPDYTTRVLKYLAGTNIKVLDYRNLWDTKDAEKYTIAGDGHPSAYANKVIAEKLIQDLGLR